MVPKSNGGDQVSFTLGIIGIAMMGVEAESENGWRITRIADFNTYSNTNLGFHWRTTAHFANAKIIVVLFANRLSLAATLSGGVWIMITLPIACVVCCVLHVIRGLVI